MPSLAESFGELNISINNHQIAQMEKLTVHFYLRRTHPLTFEGPYVAIDPVAFLPSDTDALFDIFKIRVKDVEEKIKQTPTINRNYNVQSDAFNLLCMWLVHLAPIYIKNKKICHDFQMNVLRYWHAKIFCSVVNNSWKYGASEGVMQATIAGLSKKSDIVQYQSWRKLIEAHCEKMLDSHHRFYDTLVQGGPDEAFLQVLTESQTALRAKIVTLAQAYYEAHKQGDSIGSRSAVSQNKEGEKIVAQAASVIDSATQAQVAEVLNPNSFIHDASVDLIADTFKTFSARQLKTALLKINETAILQTSSRTFDKVDIKKDEVTYIGIRALIVEVIRSMVRLCRERRINMGDRALVYKTMKDAYTSSRSLDKDIGAVKRSVTLLVDEFNITSYEASRASLRLGVICYLIYRTLEKMK